MLNRESKPIWSPWFFGGALNISNWIFKVRNGKLGHVVLTCTLSPTNNLVVSYAIIVKDTGSSGSSSRGSAGPPGNVGGCWVSGHAGEPAVLPAGHRLHSPRNSSGYRAPSSKPSPINHLQGRVSVIMTWDTKDTGTIRCWHCSHQWLILAQRTSPGWRDWSPEPFAFQGLVGWTLSHQSCAGWLGHQNQTCRTWSTVKQLQQFSST